MTKYNLPPMPRWKRPEEMTVKSVLNALSGTAGFIELGPRARQWYFNRWLLRALVLGHELLAERERCKQMERRAKLAEARLRTVGEQMLAMSVTATGYRRKLAETEAELEELQWRMDGLEK